MNNEQQATRALPSVLSLAVSGSGLVPEMGHDTNRRVTFAWDEKSRAKAEAFWKRKVEQRKRPGFCGRCGERPALAGRKQCAECVEYQSAYKRRKVINARAVMLHSAGATLEAYSRRICSLEMRLAKLESELGLKRAQFRYIKRRSAALLRREERFKRELLRYVDAYPVISKQELATINHAYDRP